MRFYLGTHKVGWLQTANVPLFISHRQLRLRRTPMRPANTWALDSGGFTELSTYGEWTISPDEYIDAVAGYAEWGGLDWAAPQDWMCEPVILEMTGKSVAEHQELTIENFLELEASGLPFIPCLQGFDLDDYLSHVEQYADAGIDLARYETVGVGSVCRRQGTRDAEMIFRALDEEGISCHGFGVKIDGLRRYADAVVSSDSMAWSVNARYQAEAVRRAGGEWKCRWLAGNHKACNNCLSYALDWREGVIAAVGAS